MKIDIKKTNRAEIMALRTQLAAALEEQNTTADELTRLNERQQKLQDEITALESAADSESEDAATKLATKRVQLEQVSKKISGIFNVDAETSIEKQGAALQLLRQFAAAALAAVEPTLEAYAQEIVEKIRPYCLNEKNTLGIAYTMPAVLSLSQTYSYRFGDYGVSVEMLKAAVARADEILAGELNWKFDPNSGK
jgi:predicted  nucleic acid-binding Zn-ribbon protein